MFVTQAYRENNQQAYFHAYKFISNISPLTAISLVFVDLRYTTVF